MKTLLFVVVVLGMLMITAPCRADDDAQTLLRPGHWIGDIVIPGGTLKIVFNIEFDGDTFTGTCDSPDQGVTGLEIGSITVTDNQVELTVPVVMGWFEGEIQSCGTIITGNWHQGGMVMDCEVTLSDAPYAVNRPQHPEPPFPYIVHDVTFSNPEANITLAGTLTVPEGEGPFPAAVLIAGSGPHDRDETIVGHKPFLVLSDHLTRNNIAVLRYDKRGIGDSEGNYMSATSDDFASDAQSALTYLKIQEFINPNLAGLIGHSEGGLVAPMVAAKHSDLVDFVVLLAAPGVPGHELLLLQSEKILEFSGESEESIQNSLKLQLELYRTVLEESNPDKAAKRIEDAIHRVYADLDDDDKSGSMTEEQLIKTSMAFNTPWFRYFLRFNPQTVLQNTLCPVLAIWGSQDIQVIPEQNLPPVARALANAGNPDVTLRVFPDLNHLFQTAKTGNITEYAQIEETFSPKALNVISEWINGLKTMNKTDSVQ
jgi:uncharacterized protein